MPLRLESPLAHRLGTHPQAVTAVYRPSSALPSLRCEMAHPSHSDVLMTVRIHSRQVRAQRGELWMILEVLDRRIEDVTEENKRFQAENILRQRKFENELEDWLTEIRDTSYIDIKEF